MEWIMGRKRRVLVAIAALVAVVLICSSAPAPVVKTRKMVALKVIGIHGYKKGEEADEPILGEIGKKLRKKFKLKRLEVIDTVHFSASSGLELTTRLGEHMKIKMKWRAVQKNIARFRITVLRGKGTILKKEVAMKLGKSSVAAAKLGKDVLILLMSSEIDKDWDD